MKERIQQSVKILAPIGTLGGFISDVLTPLGPVTKWLFLCSLAISFIFLIFYVLNKKKLAQKYLPSSIILALIFGTFFLLNNNTEKGLLGDNTESISNLQNSLFKLQETVDRVEEKVDVIDEKIDLGFEKIAELIQSNNPIENPKTPKDFIVNAYLYQSSGLLKKSQISFEEYFRLTDDYKIDILFDYCDVFETNNGFTQLKIQLDQFPSNDVTSIVKRIKTSIDLKKLFFKLAAESRNDNSKLIKWAMLYSSGADVANALAGNRAEFFDWQYYCFHYHTELGYNCEKVYQYFFNDSKAKELISHNTFSKKPLYIFYVDYLSMSYVENSPYYPKIDDDWYSKEYALKAKQQEELYLQKREEGWFR
tara:strand:+ start:108 stop:1202 length:1095 start_codon:yes stop_codon:yes gene_type:complete